MSSNASPAPSLTLADVAQTAERGHTPRELARLLRVSPDRIRAMIAAGELGALDMARQRCGRPRYIILPQHVEEFLRRRSAAPTPKPRRRKRTQDTDFYPD
jgi:excisionase family DNA binding protein